MNIFYILFLIATPLYPIVAIIILKEFNKLESQINYFKSICEEATHISMIAEEQAIKATRALNQHIEESKKQKSIFLKRWNMEVVNENELGRYAVIDMFDIIIWDSDNLEECELFYDPDYCIGIYDYKENKYIK